MNLKLKEMNLSADRELLTHDVAGEGRPKTNKLVIGNKQTATVCKVVYGIFTSSISREGTQQGPQTCRELRTGCL